MIKVDDSDIYKSLSDESIQVGTAITQKLIWAGRVPLLSLVVLTALIAFEVRYQSKNEALIRVIVYHVTSIILSGITNYYLHLTDEVEMLGGYKKYLEERINEISKSGVSLLENLYALEGKKTIKIYYIILILLPISLSIYALTKSFFYLISIYNEGAITFYPLLVIWIILLFLYFYSAREMRTLYKRSQGDQWKDAYVKAKLKNKELIDAASEKST